MATNPRFNLLSRVEGKCRENGDDVIFETGGPPSRDSAAGDLRRSIGWPRIATTFRNRRRDRLYSTLSAEEMTLDPVFVFNPDLPDVSNIHQATRVTECSRGVHDGEAPWRIDFSQGRSLHGTPQQLGQWPEVVSERPANFRVLTLAAAGDGAIVADNSELSMLSEYNGDVPRSSELGDSGGWCSVASTALPRPAPNSWVAALAAACLAIDLRCGAPSWRTTLADVTRLRRAKGLASRERD